MHEVGHMTMDRFEVITSVASQPMESGGEGAACRGDERTGRAGDGDRAQRGGQPSILHRWRPELGNGPEDTEVHAGSGWDPRRTTCV